MSASSPNQVDLGDGIGLRRHLEQQARVLEANRALERVLRITLAMRASEDIAGVVEALHQEIMALGLPAWRCAFETFDAEYPRAKTNQIWLTNADGKLQEQILDDLLETVAIHPALEELHEVRLRWEQSCFCTYLAGDGVRDYYRRISNRPGREASSAEVVGEAPDSIPPDPQFIYYFLAPDKRSNLILVLTDDLSEGDRAVLQRFAGLFSLAYARHRDFLALLESSREAQLASRAKSQFLANMSHELRTPMNSALIFSSLILEGAYGKLPAELRDAVEEIDRNGDHLLDLVNDILEISRIESGSVELDLTECTAGDCIDAAVVTLRQAAEAKGLTLTLEVEPALPVIRADERRLSQHVLVNLLKNAIKFTDQGGIRTGARRDGDRLLFWVADTGIGIPVQEQERVFETFHQAGDGQLEGTGLGLAIAREFVELHGGRIWVESGPGTGSTFFFTVPGNLG